MTNPFHKALDANLRGKKVRVVSNDGTVFVGWCERVHHHDRHVMLRDASLLQDGTEIDRGAVMVAHADTVEEVDSSSRIERVPLANVATSPYHARSFVLEDNLQYVDEVHRDGWVGSFPTVRPVEFVDEGIPRYEVVAGHKRLWAARQAGLDEHPVEIVDVSDWEAARAFVHDHLPGPQQVGGDGRHDNWYSDEEIEVAIDALVEELGEGVDDLHRVAFNKRRLESDEEPADASEEEEEEGEPAGEGEGERDLPANVLEALPSELIEQHGPSGLRREYEERYLTVDFEELVCGECGEVAQHRVQEDTYQEIRQTECSNCNAVDAAEGEPDRTEAEEPARSTTTGLPEGGDQIVEALNEEGEMSGPRLKTLTELGDTVFYNTLSELRESGIVDDRKDPEDGRRRLYSVAEEDVHEASTSDEGDDDGHQQDDGTTCSCDATFDDTLEYQVHRVEDHGVSYASFGLEQGEFEEIVNEAESIEEVREESGFGTEKLLRLLNVYGLDDVVGPNDVEISDLNDFEFDGVAAEDGEDQEPAEVWCGYCGAGPMESDAAVRDHHDSQGHPGEPVIKVEDPRKAAGDRRAETKADGGAVEISRPEAGTGGPSRECQNCGAQVTADYARVFAPEGDEDLGPRVCPNCEDKVRDMGEVREARSTRGNTGRDIA